jgi:hypothetical protein
MEAVLLWESPVTVYQTTQRYYPEDSNIYVYFCILLCILYADLIIIYSTQDRLRHLVLRRQMGPVYQARIIRE